MESRIKQLILTISISLILVFFIGYGIQTFYNSPEYEDFCNQTRSPELIKTEQDCLNMGGKWSVYPVKYANETMMEGYCDTEFTCSENFREALEPYNRNVFIIAVIAGILCVVLGGFLLKLETVSSGIMGGGVLTIIYGTLRYWGEMSDIIRWLLLGVVLTILIWIGYKKVKG